MVLLRLLSCGACLGARSTKGTPWFDKVCNDLQLICGGSAYESPYSMSTPAKSLSNPGNVTFVPFLKPYCT
eukprot:scaffold42819_cov46-Prasinocladus_malaysianus.AAC.1